MSSTASAPMIRASHHVAGVDGEVLAEHREVDGLAGRPQVVGRAAEPLLVGEHRQAGGSARARRPLASVGRVEVGGQVALRRRPALHLGDDGQLGRRRGRERARGSHAGGGWARASSSRSSMGSASAAAAARCCSRIRSR